MPSHDKFTATLLRWFSDNARDLPWRETEDPYAIWLSEVILQQTRIQQGTAYWMRFMQRFPTVEALAAASEDEVLRLWQGLGYYSRARHLHAAARQIAARGHFPDTFEGLLQLEGVGNYTAAAIGSFAFHLPTAVVDGNVFRVLSRYYGIATPINSSAGAKEFRALAQSLLPENQSADFNQAMMDFGAMQCTPASPHCHDCPLLDSCEAHASGRVTLLPVKNKTIRIRTRQFKYIYLRYDHHTAIRQRPAGDIWQGLWEPLLLEDGNIPKYDGKLTLLRKDVKHVLTHQIIHADFFLMELRQKPELPEEYVWIDESRWNDYAVSRLVEMLIEEVRKRLQ